MPMLGCLRHVVIAVTVAPLLLLGLPAHAPAASAAGLVSTSTVDRVPKVVRAMRIAKRQIGDPYRWGAAGPHRFDCSGLIYFSTHKAGFRNVPRTSSAQSRFMRRIPRSAMRRGDFVFFTGSSGVYHVAIYIGRKDGRRFVVHSPSTGSRVHRSPIWTSSWFAGTLRGR